MVVELHHVLQKRLIVNTRNPELARHKLMEAGYPVRAWKEGMLAITSGEAISRPEHVATFLTKLDLPPTLLKVEEEDLESYFLRTIG